MKIQPYQTLKIYSEIELKERKSVFLAKAYPVSNEDDVNSLLNDLKKKYYDASHRCYAYRLISGKSKFSDAGEPSGSAGIRILNAIDHFELQNCLVVVIRYFGGTKLGIGPLGKAYYSAVIQVLTKAEFTTKKPYLETEIIFSTSSFDKVSGILTSNHIKILETLYDSEISLKCLISYELFEKVKVKTTELLRGNVIFHTSDGIIYK